MLAYEKKLKEFFYILNSFFYNNLKKSLSL